MIKKDRFSQLPRYWLGISGPSPWSLAKAARRNSFLFGPNGLLSYKPTTGAVTAALKIYMVLVAMADDDVQRNRVGRHHVKTTYEEIRGYLELSRAMIRQGLKLLEDSDAVERIEYKPLVYRIKGLDLKSEEGRKGHVKLPKGHLYGPRRTSSANPTLLANFPTRGKAAMNALALYLLLLSVARREDNLSLISYTRINERTQMSSKEIRQALDLLIHHDLISVLRVTDENTFEAFGLPVPGEALQGTANVYLIKGLKGRAYNQRVNTLENMLEVAREAKQTAAASG